MEVFLESIVLFFGRNKYKKYKNIPQKHHIIIIWKTNLQDLILTRFDSQYTHLHRFNVDNSTSIVLSKSMKYWWVLHVVFFMLFRSLIDITLALIPFCVVVSSLVTYSKLNLKFEIWKALLIRCNFKVKLTWTSNIYILLRWNYITAMFYL